MTEILVPRDVEADVLGALSRYGVDASTIVPADAGAGTVRVSRTGGDLVASNQRDLAEMLVEVWEQDSVSAFDSAIRIYGALTDCGLKGLILPGVAVHSMDIVPPRSLDDPNRPDLYRVTIPFTFITDLTTLEVEHV